MAFVKLGLLFVPLIFLVVGFYLKYDKTYPDSGRSILGYVAQAAVGAVIGGFAGAGIGLEVYCKFSDSNLCGLGGLLMGGFAGAYLGALVMCVRWYKALTPR